MSSEPEVSELTSLFQRLLRNRDMSLFLPFIFGFPESSPSTGNNEDPYHENDDTQDSHSQRIILLNPFTQGVVVVDGASSLENLFRELGSSKSGQPPASKESIEAIPSVGIVESDDLGECVVCLEEFEVGGVAKVMPCKHKFHPNCIEKWLGIHGNCPVCRYQMPVEEKGRDMKRDEEEGGGERRRIGDAEVWVSFSINGGSRRSHDSNQAPSGDSSDNLYSPSDASELEN
ncbi:hypothetical protein Lal_00024975 [Lupinus albus]|uniref:RING-type E3 ubiquitin transferase n=1 Tax=Lupinus albus TaxID=3870 RepID=A0A6A4PV33_LUPAL|nr:putative aminoacyltransferase, E1 ubiquitin-activating enzyme [Lupinus albus]KAF1889648.1 hypothetical protein Lal_00024975 [Lupinus albus]